MKRGDYTEMGGTGAAFLTTHWSLIEEAASNRETDNEVLISSLLKSYWKPVYCYLRRKGYGNEEAKDLTQGFFHEVVLGRNLIDRVDQSKGRFRSYLLIALDRYVMNVNQKKNAQKRIPQDKLVSLDAMEVANLPSAVTDLSPEELFNYTWISTLLETALERVRSQCQDDGMNTHWCLFRDRVLQPIFEAVDPPPLRELSEKYMIGDTVKASNMIVTIKRRFRAVLRDHLRRFVTSDDQLGAEMEEIRRFIPDTAQDGQ